LEPPIADLRKYIQLLCQNHLQENVDKTGFKKNDWGFCYQKIDVLSEI